MNEEKKMKKTRNLTVPILGIVIVVITTIINLLPFALIGNTPFWLINLLITNPALYYGLSGLLLMPAGTMISAIAGNRTTGLLTYVITGLVFVMSSDLTNLICSLLVVLVCSLIYDNPKMKKWVKGLITAISTSVFVVIFSMVEKIFSPDVVIILELGGFLLIISSVVVIISALLEKIPILRKLDEKSTDLDRNYRVHSINRKLMIVINVICMVLIVMFSVMSVLMLNQKEAERQLSEENVWEVVLYNAISGDGDLYYEHDYSKIEAEAGKIQAALNSGHIEVPAYVGVITNIDGSYIEQLYEVTAADDLSKSNYLVEWLGEVEMTREQVEMILILPEEGNSLLTVSENSLARGEAIKAVKRILSVAITLLVLINLLAEVIIRKNIVRPINQMTTEAMSFAFQSRDPDKDEGILQDVVRKERVEIHSGDEIESLNRAFHKTMDDVETYLDNVREKSRQLSDIQHNIIVTMADIIESRDLNTGGHIKRTAIYVGIIARKLMGEGRFAGILTQDYMDDMIVAAPLHDMGKIHVPDQILNKNGRLTDEEFAVMKSHAAVGKELLDVASESLGEFRYLMIAKQMAESHHEWWNGNGYPNKLVGEDIPLCARIMAVADVFDALVSKRCYKDAMDLDVAFGIIEKETGTHFDPVIGTAFLECREEVEMVLKELAE